MNTQQTQCHVYQGQRISYNGHLCTVRFVGQIPQWPDVLALGVEWDDASRGKHSGSIDGVKYFNVKTEGSASFIKVSKARDIERTFEKAILDRYSVNLPDAHLHQYISLKKQIEYVPDKWQGLEHTSSMSLSGLSLIDNQLPSNQLINRLQHVRRLDLSYNLLSKLSNVYQLCLGLKSLNELILSGNRLEFDLNHTWKGIIELSVADMDISNRDLNNVKNCFCDVQRLCCSRNSLFEWDHVGFRPLELLDLSQNNISEIRDNINNVEILNLSHNSLTFCQLTDCQNLDISHNQIESWSSLKLSNDVRDLRIVNNPVFDASMGTIQVIARYGNLHKLNGTLISEQERVDAELYFMNHLVDDEFKISGRWKDLVDIHGEPKVKKKPQTLRSKTIELTVNFNGQQKPLKILQTMTIQKVKLQAARLWKQNALNVDLTDENGSVLQENDQLPSCISLISK